MRSRAVRHTRGGITIATIDELLDKVDSKYTLVHLSARRAREINSYYHSLGEGLGQYTPPLVDSSSNKPLSIALEEIAAQKIVVQHPGDALRVAEELLGAEAQGDVGGDVVDFGRELEGGGEAGTVEAAEAVATDGSAADSETPEDAAGEGLAEPSASDDTDET